MSLKKTIAWLLPDQDSNICNYEQSLDIFFKSLFFFFILHLMLETTAPKKKLSFSVWSALLCWQQYKCMWSKSLKEPCFTLTQQRMCRFCKTFHFGAHFHIASVLRVLMQRSDQTELKLSAFTPKHCCTTWPGLLARDNNWMMWTRSNVLWG